MPLVSIITPAYNAAEFLPQTIASVISQTYPHWELLIVVDAKSSDKTAAIATAAALSDERIKVIQDPHNQGICANRNRGLDSASGSYIAFLDSDDRWLPNKLETQVKAMLTGQQSFSFHSFAVINEEGTAHGPDRRAIHPVTFHSLLKDNSIGCLTVMIKKELIASQRMKDVRHEDFEFWLRLLKDGTIAYPIPAVLAEYRVRQNSVSENKWKSAVWRWRVYKELEIPTLKAGYYMIYYVLSGLLKRF